MNTTKWLMLGLVVAAIGCQKTPDLDQLSTNQVVATDRDLQANFANYSTYHISDTVSIVATDPKDSILTGPLALQLVNAVKTNMNSRGYTFVARNASPDLGLRLTVIKDVTRTAVCGGWWDGWWGWYPPYWWGYPGGGYYYPWCTTYTYTIGTSTLYMFDIKSAKGGSGTIRALWGATAFGVFSTTNNNTNAQLTVDAINQAYQQSPYIQK